MADYIVQRYTLYTMVHTTQCSVGMGGEGSGQAISYPGGGGSRGQGTSQAEGGGWSSDQTT